eukprot:SAG11_NODE_11841_length_735_cov_2.264151_1_plen_56_part_00
MHGRDHTWRGPALALACGDAYMRYTSMLLAILAMLVLYEEPIGIPYVAVLSVDIT